MKRNIEIIFTATAASLLSLTALAEDKTPPIPARTDYAREHAGRSQGDRLQSAAKASDMIGMRVENYQGGTLGKIEDLALDLESGRIVQVILSSGGVVGVGDRLSAVPPGVLH